MDRAFGSPAEDRPPLKPRVTPRNRLRLPVPIVKLTRYGLWVMWSAATHQVAADAVNKAHTDWGKGSGEHAPPARVAGGCRSVPEARKAYSKGLEELDRVRR